MKDGFIVVIVVAGVLVLLGAYVGICMARVAKMPDMHPSKYVAMLRRHQAYMKTLQKDRGDTASLPVESVKYPHPNPSNTPVMVVIGDSHTQCTYSADWMSSMSEQVKDKVFVINAGINGEQTDQIAARLDNILLCNPKYVFIMAGSNDRLCANCTCSACAYGQCTRPRCLNTYKEDYTLLLRRLILYTTAYIGVLSVPPLEAPDNDRVNADGTRTVNEQTKDIVKTLQARYPRRLEYVAVDELYAGFIRNDESNSYFSPPHRLRWMPHTFVSNVMRAQFLHWVCGLSYDAISSRYGMRFTIDAIHLNTAGGKLLEDTVVEVFSRMCGRVDNEGNIAADHAVALDMETAGTDVEHEAAAAKRGNAAGVDVKPEVDHERHGEVKVQPGARSSSDLSA